MLQVPGDRKSVEYVLLLLKAEKVASVSCKRLAVALDSNCVLLLCNWLCTEGASTAILASNLRSAAGYMVVVDDGHWYLLYAS